MPDYHQFQLSPSRGEDGATTRVYVPHTGQTREEAEKTLTRAQRKRVEHYQEALATSTRRAQAEEAGLPFPVPPKKTRRRKA